MWNGYLLSFIYNRDYVLRYYQPVAKFCTCVQVLGTFCDLFISLAYAVLRSGYRKTKALNLKILN